MAITEHPTDTAATAAARVPEGWLETRATLECACPEPCLIDHDN